MKKSMYNHLSCQIKIRNENNVVDDAEFKYWKEEMSPKSAESSPIKGRAVTPPAVTLKNKVDV